MQLSHLFHRRIPKQQRLIPGGLQEPGRWRNRFTRPVVMTLGSCGAIAIVLTGLLYGPANNFLVIHPAHAGNVSTAPLLPGETLWNGVPNYLFGANDAYDWAGGAGLDQQPGIQATVKNAQIPLIRIWFFEYDETTGAPVSDATQEAIYQAAIANTGATCFANLYTTNDEAYDLHIVSLFKGKCELYEVMNEPDSDSSITPDSYTSFWNSFVPQARAIDPNARFGGPATTVPMGYDCTWDNSGNDTCFTEKWLQGTVASGVRPDFVTFHWYTCWNEDQTTCLSEAGNIQTVGDSTVALVNKYYPGQNIPVGLTEWNDNAGNPSYGYDDTFMSQYEQASLAGLEQSNLSFATQFDLASYAGYGSLDMFRTANPEVTSGSTTIDYTNTPSAMGSPRPMFGVLAGEIARLSSGSVSVPTATPAPQPTATPKPVPTATPAPYPTATPVPMSTPTPTPVPASGTNLGDGCFNNATSYLSPWFLPVQGGAGGSVSKDTSNYVDCPDAVRINVTTASSTSWYLQLDQTHLNLVAGHTYTLSFYAQASTARTFNVGVQHATSPWTVYDSYSPTLAAGNAWQKYCYTFTPTVSDSNVLLDFNVANQTGSIWLDDISLQ